MRHGISRDGSHLYPAFPYTAFAKTSDADLQALYAYLMAQPSVSTDPQPNALTFPFSVRSLMAGWNTLYHDAAPFQPDPLQSELYNRGAYLAEGLGHCSACHSPRNALGAEKNADAYLAGAFVDGWEAPPLNGLSRAPVAWSEASLYDYLRHGESELHGVASGPMAPVVAGLAELPEYDVRAIAHYVAAQMQAPSESGEPDRAGAEQRVANAAVSAPGWEAGERLFEGACAACHVETGVPSFSRATTQLALNTNLHSDHPDNVIQSILGGVHADHVPGIGHMPGFADSFSNTQVADLATYLRARFAPDKAPWQQVEQRIEALRQPHHNNTHSSP
jgi:nicotinate dehydrogenase subunit B